MKSSPLRQTANEQAEFNFYKNRVLELENQVEELTQELRIKHLEAENEQERSECLEIMLKKLGEKDDTTEMLLSELKEENLSLADRVSALQDELMDKELLLRNVQDRCAELENSPDNRDIPQGIDDNHYEIMEAYERTKEELEQKRENVESLEREMNSRTALFQERLSLVERERDELRNSLIVERSKSSYSSLELENKSGEANEHLHRLQHAFSMMQTIFPYFSMAMRDVEGEVHDRLQLLEERLTSSADSLYELSRHYVVRHAEDDDLSNAPIPRSLLEKTLRDTQTALQDALDRHERDEQRFAELEDELGHLNNERHGHLETIQELERQNMNLRNASKNMTTSVSAVEVSDLKARLCAVESRAEKAAAEHAKLYAQHVKVIGYLESECTRLRGLGDHFRAVNSKLMADVKQAQLQGMKAKGLEHRVSMLIESEKTIANKLQVSEKALMERNEEFIALVRDKEAEEMERQRRVEKEVAMYNQQIEDLQHKLLDANRTIDNVTDKLRVHEHEGKLELHHLKLKLDHLEHENMIQSRHTEELEFELRQCREDIRQKDFLLSQSDVKLTLLSQDSVASNSNYERTVKDLAIELEEKLMRVQVLDQALGTMRSRVVEVEAQLLSKDEEITMRLIQKGDLESEVQQLKDMLQEKAAEALELRQTNMFLETERSTLSTRLQALEERYHELTDVNLKQVHDRLIKSDTALR
ncbi:hypothetical protein EON65_00465 [archaeon]|nr:MAG: hypothetical protein EON65_00465 [archaeon]